MMIKSKTIFYINYFDVYDKYTGRTVSPAAVKKSRYIASKISSLGYNVQIISPALPNKPGLYKSSNKTIFGNVKLKLFRSFYTKHVLFKIYRRILHSIKVCLYLLINIPKRSTVIVYHSLSLMKMVKLLKLTKNINLVLEMEEIYGDVIKKYNISQTEMRFSRLANSYIFPTELLEAKINVNKKPSVIIYGNYEINFVESEPRSDGLIHCVYAGTLSKEKRGALLSAAEFLGKDYHLHILGFGSNEEIIHVLNSLRETQLKAKCKITYHGLLLGDEFDDFISKCQIGLSPQTLDNNFNDTSFPSKILMYLSYGLKVVSGKIKAVSESVLKDYVTLYDIDSPESIAEAIKLCATQTSALSSRDLLIKLDSKFGEDLKRILNK